MHDEGIDAPGGQDDTSGASPRGRHARPAGSRRSGADAEHAHHSGSQKAAVTLVAAIMTPLLVLVMAAGMYVGYLDRIVGSNVNQSNLLPDGDGPERLAAAGGAENYLFIGSDSRSTDAENRGHSDVIMWVHIDKAHRRVDLIHVPRDYYVDIPGQQKNKINASYLEGGAPRLVETLHSLYKVRIDHVAIIDFEGFKHMTDAVGGITLRVPEDMASAEFPAGEQHMDGHRALRFVRERKTLDQQDISRGKRQQLYLKTLLLRALSDDVLMDPVRFADFVDAATGNLTLDQNFSKGNLRDKALQLRGVRANTVFFWSAPWVSVGMEGYAGAVVYPNFGLVKELGQHLAEDTMETYVDEETPKSGFAQTPQQRAKTQSRGDVTQESLDTPSTSTAEFEPAPATP